MNEHFLRPKQSSDTVVLKYLHRHHQKFRTKCPTHESQPCKDVHFQTDDAKPQSYAFTVPNTYDTSLHCSSNSRLLPKIRIFSVEHFFYNQASESLTPQKTIKHTVTLHVTLNIIMCNISS